jgi:hypothetical protein
MSLRAYVRTHGDGQGRRPVPPKMKVLIAPSDDDVKRRFHRFRPKLQDSFVDVEGTRIGWKRTNAGTLGAIYVNEFTGQRTLWVLDFVTREPFQLAILH